MVEAFWNQLFRDYPRFSYEVRELKSIFEQIGLLDVTLLCRFKEEVILKDPDFWIKMKDCLSDDEENGRAERFVTLLCMDNSIDIRREPVPKASRWDRIPILKRLRDLIPT